MDGTGEASRGVTDTTPERAFGSAQLGDQPLRADQIGLCEEGLGSAPEGFVFANQLLVAGEECVDLDGDVGTLAAYLTATPFHIESKDVPAHSGAFIYREKSTPATY